MARVGMDSITIARFTIRICLSELGLLLHYGPTRRQVLRSGLFGLLKDKTIAYFKKTNHLPIGENGKGCWVLESLFIRDKVPFWIRF